MKPISDEELEWLRERFLLSMLLTVLERDKKLILNSSIKYKRPYIKMIEQAIDNIQQDLVQVKRRLYRAGIKVLTEDIEEECFQVKFLCRGYNDVFQMSWDLVRAEIEVRIEKYFRGR